MFIYCIQNKTNRKQYVGLTTKSLQERFGYHVAQAKINALKNMVIAKAIIKYGSENFTIRSLEECDNYETLKTQERYWIGKLDTFNNGYNMTKGGEGLLGYKHTEETKKRMSERMLGNTYNKGHFLGKSHTEETKKKMSDKKVGANNGMFGRGHSEEARKKISQAHYKKVCQYDDVGNLIKIHNSFQEAAKYVNGKSQGITRCCKGIRNHHRGYVWKYYLENNKGIKEQEIK